MSCLFDCTTLVYKGRGVNLYVYPPSTWQGYSVRVLGLEYGVLPFANCALSDSKQRSYVNG